MYQLTKFGANEHGATAVEYALIAAVISVAIVGGLAAFESSMTEMFEYLAETINPALVGEGG